MDFLINNPFSCLIVTYNEEKHLETCLRSLDFCDQIVVVDLGSTDRSVEIAKKCNAEVYLHEWAPIVEEIWPEVVHLSRNKWIIRMDPDEVFPSEILSELILLTYQSNIGCILVPYQYYFRNKPLKTTIWGGVKYILKIFHQDRVSLTNQIHQGIYCLPQYTVTQINAKNNNIVSHYWADSYEQLIKKHLRYINKEGKSRFDKGDRFSWKGLYREFKRAVRVNFIESRTITGSFDEIFLGFFYIWYVIMSMLSLKKYEKKRELINNIL